MWHRRHGVVPSIGLRSSVFGLRLSEGRNLKAEGCQLLRLVLRLDLGDLLLVLLARGVELGLRDGALLGVFLIQYRLTPGGFRRAPVDLGLQLCLLLGGLLAFATILLR